MAKLDSLAVLRTIIHQAVEEAAGLIEAIEAEAPDSQKAIWHARDLYDALCTWELRLDNYGSDFL